MDSWCGAGAKVSWTASGPSACFNASITTTIPCVFILIAGLNRRAALKSRVSYHEAMNAKERLMLYLFVSMSVFMSLLTVLHSIFWFGCEVPAAIVSETLQFLAWVCCAFLVSYECSRDVLWPSNVVKIFTALELIANCIVYVSTAGQLVNSQASSVPIKVTSYLGFFFNVSLVLLGVFKYQHDVQSSLFVDMTELEDFGRGGLNRPRDRSGLCCHEWPRRIVKLFENAGYTRVYTNDPALLGETRGNTSALERCLSNGEWTDGYSVSSSVLDTSGLSSPHERVPLSSLMLSRIASASNKVQSFFRPEATKSDNLESSVLDREVDSNNPLLPQGAHAPVYSIAINRWELSKKRGRSSTPLMTSPDRMGDAAAVPTFSPASLTTEAVGPLAEKSEVVFEVRIRCSPSAEMEWWGRKYGEDIRWSVWRSANDVLELHRSITVSHGLQVPVKRPRLRTAASGSELEVGPHGAFLSEDITMDMRTITAYLRSLLTMRTFHGQILADFLGANEEGLSAHEEALQEQADIQIIEVYTERLQLPRSDARVVEKNPMAEDMMLTQQERWRRILLRLRRELGERAITVRLRTFAAVISGHDIVHTLMAIKECDTREDAHRISQELLTSHLLVPVCCGFDSWGIGKPKSKEEDVTASQQFREAPAYLYSYPSREVFYQFSEVNSAHVGIKGGRKWQRRDRLFAVELELKVVDHILIPAGSGAHTNVAHQSQVGSGSGSVVLFQIVVSHAEDAWEVHRRFREFSQLDRRLLRAGLRAPVVLPAKAIFGLPLSNAGLLARRAKLEQYLAGVVQLAFQSPDTIGPIIADFLDPLFGGLQICGTDGSFVLHSDGEQAQDTAEEDEILQVVEDSSSSDLSTNVPSAATPESEKHPMIVNMVREEGMEINKLVSAFGFGSL